MEKVILIFVMVLVTSLITTSCSNQSTGETGTEMGEGEGPEGSESGGSGEGSEGGSGEGSEGSGGEGSEGSGGEGGNESGMLWNVIDTADEIVNGIHLILSYDPATESFVGTLENINTNTAPQVRVEVHVFDAAGNSIEFGPTVPADMAPGEIRDVTLPITSGTTFVQFNMHPEVGGSSSEGSGGEGSEGSNGEGSEGSGGEGSEGSGEEAGNESGMLWNSNETADEIVNGIRLILSYDASTESFVGTLENKNTTIAPQVRVEVHVLDAAGNSTEFGPTTPADMAPGEIRNVTLPITTGTTFTQFNMHPEVGTANTGG